MPYFESFTQKIQNRAIKFKSFKLLSSIKLLKHMIQGIGRKLLDGFILMKNIFSTSKEHIYIMSK